MEQFCREIGIPEEVIRRIVEVNAAPNFKPDTGKLCRAESWEEGLSEVKQMLGEDPLGDKMLCAQLRCAMKAWHTYEKLGFSREIYVDTMRAFTRFVEEHLVSFGTYGFDRAFWTVRQISCRLFRIGQLEYELIHQDDKPVLALHIPSDADLSLPGLRESYVQARQILGQVFPEWTNAPIYCRSWLLSQNLPQLLPENSRILGFQRSFRITPVQESNTSVLLWVFKNREIPLPQLPEDTSLQRRLKAFLLSGGVFLEGEGYLIEDPFLS